jgi:hypothetical protein
MIKARTTLADLEIPFLQWTKTLEPSSLLKKKMHKINNRNYFWRIGLLRFSYVSKSFVPIFQHFSWVVVIDSDIMVIKHSRIKVVYFSRHVQNLCNTDRNIFVILINLNN